MVETKESRHAKYYNVQDSMLHGSNSLVDFKQTVTKYSKK